MTTLAALALVEVTLTEGALRLGWQDGLAGGLAWPALRDLCACDGCRTPSGQRLFESVGVVEAARPARVEHGDGKLELLWEDGHASRFELGDLRLEVEAGRAGARAPQRPVVHWGAELAGSLPRAAYDDVGGSLRALRDWLASCATYGFGLLRGVPPEPGRVAEVVAHFGHVRETNYGRVFDVEVAADPLNLADTALALSAHTDNPYRSPTPTLQLLHCLRSSVDGGDTVLVDGFAAAERLRADDGAAYELLAGVPVRFEFRDRSTWLRRDVPVLETDARGGPAALHVNNRSKGVPVGDAPLVVEWYRAYARLVARLAEPAAELVFRLEPGDLVLLDNERVLHGRTAFTSGGERRLQGCYADRDGLLGRLAYLDSRLQEDA